MRMAAHAQRTFLCHFEWFKFIRLPSAVTASTSNFSMFTLELETGGSSMVAPKLIGGETGGRVANAALGRFSKLLETVPVWIVIRVATCTTPAWFFALQARSVTVVTLGSCVLTVQAKASFLLVFEIVFSKRAQLR